VSARAGGYIPAVDELEYRSLLEQSQDLRRRFLEVIARSRLTVAECRAWRIDVDRRRTLLPPGGQR